MYKIYTIALDDKAAIFALQDAPNIVMDHGEINRRFSSLIVYISDLTKKAKDKSNAGFSISGSAFTIMEL